MQKSAEFYDYGKILDLQKEYSDQEEMLDKINDYLVDSFSGTVDRMSILAVRDERIIFAYVRDSQHKEKLENKWVTPWRSLEGEIINSIPPKTLTVKTSEHPLYYSKTAAETGIEIPWISLHPLIFLGNKFGCLEFICTQEPCKEEIEIMSSISKTITPTIYNFELIKKINKVAHNIRNDMHVILGIQRTIMPKLAAEDKETKDLYELTIERATFVSEECSKLLCKTETDLVYGSVNIALSHCIKNLRPLANFNIQLELKELPPTNYSSRALTKEVFFNIGYDCLKVLQERQIKEPWLEIKSYSKNGRVFVSFSDNGGGIPQEIKVNLFNLNQVMTGHGYGLGIARELIYSHGGELLVEDIKTKCGRGTRFTVELPVTYIPSL